MHFDNEAQTWDNDPKKTERAKIVSEEIISYIKNGNGRNAMEFGCGTGLLSFQLKDFFKSITLIDNSEGMIKVLKEKIAKSGINNFKPVYIQSFEDEISKAEYDVIYTLMTLDHTLDLSKIAEVFHSALKYEGYLCIADLVKEDGSFHSHIADFEGHNGFERNSLMQILTAKGFEVVFYKVCLEIEKISDNKIMKYPLFLMICKKN